MSDRGMYFDIIPSHRFGGVERSLACLEPYGISGYRPYVEVLGLDEGLLAQQAFQARLLTAGLTLPKRDQGQTSACTGFASSMAVIVAHALRGGGQVLDLSPTYAYSKINHGVDRGAVLSDLLDALKRFGVAPASLFPQADLFVGQGSSDADRRAAQYRLEEAYQVTSAAQLADAITREIPCLMGIAVGVNFDQVDSDGVSPPPVQIRGRHALPVDELFVSPKYGLCVGGENSWGPSFGVNGRYRVPLNAYLPAGQPVDAFALVGLVADPDVDGPKAK